ncbi:MAG TPA: winged helix-turn-helix transcriptional regulator [Mycobacteriales bacterium]|nr:winged helix-turn-helix transcriptional regulator [Mycobacteriales bacterium]
MSDAPLFDLIDLLGRRHALPLIWALRQAPEPFGVLVSTLAAPEAVLSQRLRELRATGLLEVDEAGSWRLTMHGRRLLDPLEQLADFAGSWSQLGARQRVPRGSVDRGRGQH